MLNRKIFMHLDWLPKILSSYPLSPQRRKRVRVRREKKNLLATGIKTMLCLSASWSRLVLAGIFGAAFCLAVIGCASLGRMAPDGTRGETTPETPKSLAYYHFLKAQQLLVADDTAGAIREYETAIQNDPESASIEMELAALYQRQGDVKQALAHAEKSLRLDPKQQEAYFLLASLHVGLNQLEEATREYERILTLDPKNREARLFLATLYAQQRRYPKAIRTVQELLRLDPTLVVGYYYLGRIYLETNRLPDAKKEFLRVLNMDPKFVPAMFDLGVTLEREHQYSRALAMYRRILRAYPRNSKVWTSIGRLYLIMNRYSDAQKAFRKVRELERNDPGADFNIALICLEQKLPDDAIRLFRPLLSVPRYQERVRYFIAMGLEEKGDLKAAAIEYQLVNQESEYFIQARLRLAYLTFQRGDKAQARQILNDLLTRAPKQEEIYLTKSLFYEEDNQWDLAIQALTAGLGQVERPQEIHFRLAVLYEKQNNRPESIQQIKKVLELDPNNADAQNFLGYSYAEAGVDLDEAEKLIREALSAKPNSGHIIDSLGWVYYKKGQYDKAVAELERAHRIMPQDGTVAEHLGDAYFKQKRYRDALRTYRRALELENANPPSLRKKINQVEILLRGPTP